jgi:cystathionine beta-lyase/cystathionine gamma-synthase
MKKGNVHMEFNDLKAQYLHLKPRIDARMQAVLDHGQFIMGPEVAELEQALCQWTGSKACITCSSGTDALLIAMMALGIGDGDEVVTTPFSLRQGRRRSCRCRTTGSVRTWIASMRLPRATACP